MAPVYLLMVFLILGPWALSAPAGPVKRETAEVVDDEGEASVGEENTKHKGKQPKAKETKDEYENFEVITDEDKKKADQAIMKELLRYAGYTLLAVAFSIFTIVSLLIDPRACLVAFSTGSPCCMLFPCYRDLMQYTDPSKLIRANVNVYVPGIYIEEDGTVKDYPPTPDEMDCLHDLVSEFLTVE